MQIQASSGASFYGSILRSRATSGGAGAADPVPSRRADLREFARSLIELRDQARGLGRTGRLQRAASGPRAPRVLSSAAFSLSLVEAPTTLRSTAEVNTVPTSYSTTRPRFAGSSSSSPTVRGTYDGSNGDTTLRFRAKVGGLVGLTPIVIEVRNAQNTVLQTVNVGTSAAGTFFTLNNGLQFSLSSGSVALNDSFTVDVSQSVGSAVRIDKPFNGTFDNTPNFEPGLSVQAGSFRVNGVSIAVAASDTVTSVLARITASTAGVTAAFDAATERVTLTQKSPGATAGIVLANDTSRFLQATKLNLAVAVPGSLDERRVALANVPAFAGISSGTFAINGHSFTLDAGSDSLVDVLERIEAAGLGLTASFAAGRVLVRGPGNAPLVIDDGDTGLFTALRLATGTHEPRRGTAGPRFASESELRVKLRAFVKAYGAAFEGDVAGYGGSTVASMRADLDRISGGVFARQSGGGGSGSLRSGLGLNLIADTSDNRRLALDTGGLDRALARDPEELQRLLFARSDEDGEDGLLAEIVRRVDRALETLATLLGAEGSAGLALDLLA